MVRKFIFFLVASVVLTAPVSALAANGSNPSFAVGYTPLDASGTIAAGGSFQQVFAANPFRVGCFIQNPINASEALSVHWTAATATVANSLSLAPGSSFTCNGNGVVLIGAITVTASTTGHAFMASGA